MKLFGKLAGLLKPDKYFDAIILLGAYGRLIDKREIENALTSLNLGGPSLRIKVQEGVTLDQLSVTHDEFRFDVIFVPRQYLPAGYSAEKLAAQTRDQRLAEAILAHRGFVSCNAQGWCPAPLRARTGEVISMVAAALADESTLAMWDANTNRLIIPTEEGLDLLREGKRDEGFDLLAWDPIGLVDSESLEAEIAEAKRRFPEFAAAFRAADDRAMFGLKAAFPTDSESVEHMWIQPAEIHGDVISGRLLSQPFDIAKLQEGMEVSVQLADVSDWFFVEDDKPVGMFTERKVRGLE